MPPDLQKIKDAMNVLLNHMGTGQGQSKLHVAAAEGNIQAVRELVRSGMDINSLGVEQQITPLHCAVAARRFQMVKELISLGADVNLKSTSQVTALLTAIIRGEMEIVKLLLDSGADINGRVEHSDSVLHVAGAYNRVEIGELLIERGLDVDLRNGQDETPLHNAAKAGTTEFVKMLIAKGADINAGACTISWLPKSEDPMGSNVAPLHLATVFDFPDVIDVLVKAKADVDAKTSTKYSALHIAVQKGSLKLVNKLLAAGSDVNAFTQSGRTPLLLAVRSVRPEIVKALLSVEGIQVNTVIPECPETPLVWAASKGHLEFVKLLVAKGANVSTPSVNGVTPIYAAIAGGNEKVIKFLINNGADVNVKGLKNSTPLHTMCTVETPLNLIKLLLDKGADINARSEDGSTPLLSAAHADNVEIVKYLISRGADPNATNSLKMTALHTAVMAGNSKTAKFLVKKVANINAGTVELMTPLHFAVVKNHRDIAKILLRSGADINAREAKTQRTALHLAALGGLYNFAELLLKHRATVDLKDNDGHTPLFLAVMNKHEKLVNLLLDKGADPNTTNRLNLFPIDNVAFTGSAEIAKALLAKGAYFNMETQSKAFSGSPYQFAKFGKHTKLIRMLELIEELFIAVYDDDLQKIKCWVQAGAIVNAREVSGRTALHTAVINRNIEAIRILLTNGADVSFVSNKGEIPLHLAVGYKYTEVVEILLAHAKNLSFAKYNLVVNAKTKERSTTALHIAAEKNSAHLVKLLLAHGAVYNTRNNFGRTPSELTTDEAIESLFGLVEKLFQAVKKEDGRAEVTQILERDDSVANARAVDGGGTPLYWAVSKGHTDIANALLARGADYRLVTDKGTTTLHIAASKGNVEVIKMLVSKIKMDKTKKANDFLDATTTSGTAALHVALNVDIVKCLLQAGATFDICNGDNKTALELAKDDDVKRLLQITHQLFEDVKKGASSVSDTLNGLEVEEFKAVSGTRNKKGLTLSQVAVASGHVKTAGKLVERLKNLLITDEKNN